MKSDKEDGLEENGRVAPEIIYQDLFEYNPQPMWVYDLENYRILDVNEAAIRHYGYTKEEFLSLTIKALRPEQDIPVITAAVEIVKKHERLFTSGVYRHQKKNGEIIQVRIQGNIIYVNGRKAELILVTDVTERMEKKMELMASERRFKALVQEGADLIAILDTEGNYMFVSESSARILGIPPEEFIGKNAFDYIHTEDREQVQALFSTITEQKQIRTEPFRFIDSNGEYRWITTIATNLTDDPAVRGIVTNSRDITDTVTKSQDLEKSNELYRLQNEKLKEIAWTQSHVVRAPLARLMGLIDLLQIGECGDLGKEGVLTHIKSSAYELDRVVKDIVHKAE